MASASALPVVDLLLRGGRISTFAAPGEGPAQVQSLAIVGGRVVAAGDDEELAGLVPLAARVVQLEGRRAIPGLNDSHIHAVRGGLSWSVSLHWDGVRSLDEALAALAARARELPAGAWISVVGGWHRSQFEQRRPPSREELDAAAPDHPVYVQETYDFGFLNSAGLAACGWATADAPDPERGRLERDAQGRPTGVLTGVGAFAVPLGLALAADESTRRAGTLQMLRDFAAHGLTGAADGGGLLITPADYAPLYALWREGGLPVRMRLFMSAWDRGGELGNIDAFTALSQPDFGDGMLQVSGIGEIPHLGCHDMEGFDAFEVPQPAYRELVQIARLCATRGWRMSVHAVLDSTLSRILDAWEEVEREVGGIAGRRFSIVHADAASDRNLDRLAALGAGVLVQNRLLLKAGDYLASELWGAGVTEQSPPLGRMRERGIPIGAGTDATRANWFSPWASIWWLVTGRSLDGAGRRAPEHRLSRHEALLAYTSGSAWFTGEDDHRGKLLPGFDGDLTVPTQDPYECGEDELLQLRSDLTIMGGAITHAAGAFAGLEEGRADTRDRVRKEAAA